MSRATGVKKKSVVKAAKAVKAVKAKKTVARSAATKARAPARKNATAARAAAPRRQSKPAAKPAAKSAAKSAANSAPALTWKPAEGRAQERYAGMTESEIMRAPASQYMNAAQLAFFRERLQAMARELLEKADVTSEHLREHDIEPDPTDQATIEEEYALELRARDRERKLLKKIEQSLRHIEDGSYGYCEETGEPIGIARMLARPTATLTIEAQSRRELKQKLYGD